MEYIPSGRGPLKFAIGKIKQKVSVTDYLEAHGIEVRNRRARCILHDGNNPTAFSMTSDGQRWHCFACGLRGDVVDLCELSERHGDTWTAVVALSLRFNVELPERPGKWRVTERGRERESSGWYAWQDEKKRRRDVLRNIRARKYQRRFFRWWYADYLASIENPEERKRETAKVWDELWPFCWGCAQ